MSSITKMQAADMLHNKETIEISTHYTQGFGITFVASLHKEGSTVKRGYGVTVEKAIEQLFN